MKSWCVALSLLLTLVVDARTFVHPGIDVSQADIDRARKLVAEGREPWASAFAALPASGWSNPDIGVSDHGTTLSTRQCNGTIGRDGRRARRASVRTRITGTM